jgi:cytochrome oxidase Cu insertion factor (SCO1/SenC/PrrC family)
VKGINIQLTGIIAVLILGVALFTVPAGALSLSLQEDTGQARLSPEIKALLQKNNLRPAQYQTPAPDFTLYDLDGNKVSLSQFRGKTVLLGFFTTW